MLKYVSKFALEILPSLVATVIGAYIVNHYIVAKPGADAPVAAAISTAPKAAAKAAPEVNKAAPEVKIDAKTVTKAPETSDVANIPEPGVKAKGISEKAILEKSTVEKSTEKSADRPAETASIIPADTRRHQPIPREKAAKVVPAPAQTSAPAVQPSAPPVVTAVSAPNPAPPAEAATAPEDRRDANDLARAAIERLRGADEGSARSQEAARVPDTARLPEAPRVVSAIRPLPPPIMVSTPGRETIDSTTGSFEAKPPYAAAARNDDLRRPTPPADIPSSPLDLRAEASEPSARAETSGGPLARARNTAEDVLSAAKSVFHAVLPK